MVVSGSSPDNKVPNDIYEQVQPYVRLNKNNRKQKKCCFVSSLLLNLFLIGCLITAGVFLFRSQHKICELKTELYLEMTSFESKFCNQPPNDGIESKDDNDVENLFYSDGDFDVIEDLENKLYEMDPEDGEVVEVEVEGELDEDDWLEEEVEEIEDGWEEGEDLEEEELENDDGWEGGEEVEEDDSWKEEEEFGEDEKEIEDK